MSYVRSDGYKLKDPDDDAAYQTVVGDLQRLAIALFRGSQNAAYTLTPESAAAINAPATSSPSVQQAAVGISAPSGSINGSALSWAGTEFNYGSVFSTTLSSGTIAPNVSGYYLATVTFTFNCGTLGFGSAVFYARILKNGSAYGELGRTWTYTASNNYSVSVTHIIECSAGDAISAVIDQNGGAGSPSITNGNFWVTKVA